MKKSNNVHFCSRTYVRYCYYCSRNVTPPLSYTHVIKIYIIVQCYRHYYYLFQRCMTMLNIIACYFLWIRVYERYCIFSIAISISLVLLLNRCELDITVDLCVMPKTENPEFSGKKTYQVNLNRISCAHVINVFVLGCYVHFYSYLEPSLRYIFLLFS